MSYILIMTTTNSLAQLWMGEGAKANLDLADFKSL